MGTGKEASHLIIFFFALCLGAPWSHPVGMSTATETVPVHVGVILDLQNSSLVGRMCKTSLEMAVEDFYASKGRNYRTRLVLHPRNSKSEAVAAASAAVDLIKDVKVHAIVGPQTSAESAFVVDVGNRTRVPVVSFTASSPSLSPARSPYFVRMALNSSAQVEAIAAVAKAFGWREVVPVYEDTEYGRGFLPYLVDALQDVDARVPYGAALPPSATDEHIAGELTRLANSQTRVFVVHMLRALGSRLFLKAKELGLTGRGYVWITTDGLTDIMGTLKAEVVDAMQGVIGLKPYVPESTELLDFKTRWRGRFRRENPDAANVVADINIYALWAYDTVWAMARAVEDAGITSSSFDRTAVSGVLPQHALSTLGVSQTGPSLLKALLRTKFRGLSGEFRLVDGQLQSSTFQVLNVVDGRGRVIGYWTPTGGVSPRLNSTSNPPPSSDAAGKGGLGAVTWPGGATDVPRGWQIPVGKERLRIAVPDKNGFPEFVHVDWKNSSNTTGYSIDVFKAVIASLNYTVSYEFVPVDAQGESRSYDLLVQQVRDGVFDAAVGDITIIAERAQHADFTLPYTESGVSMVVPIMEDNNKNAWIFLKPLTADLWLGSMAFFVFTGFVVWVIEHRVNEEFRGPPAQQMGTIFYFAFSTMVYAHRERVESNLSRFVVIIWVFVVLILTSSYTASLTSMLTVQQLQPAVTDVNQLLKNGDYVGYQNGSFVKDLLIKRLRFEASKMRPFVNSAQYAEALSRGSRNGGVAAIFDEIPYVKIFLTEHCSKFTMVGPTYKTDGFGFVFPRGSPLVPDVSRAILRVTERDKKLEDVDAWLGNETVSCKDKNGAIDSGRLSFRSFWGLFLITGTVSAASLLWFFVSFVYRNRAEVSAAAANRPRTFGERMAAWARHYDDKDLSSHTFKEGRHGGGCDCASRVHTPVAAARSAPPGDGADQSPPTSISLRSFADAGAGQEEGRSSTSSAGTQPAVELIRIGDGV